MKILDTPLELKTRKVNPKIMEKLIKSHDKCKILLHHTELCGNQMDMLVNAFEEMYELFLVAVRQYLPKKTQMRTGGDFTGGLAHQMFEASNYFDLGKTRTNKEFRNKVYAVNSIYLSQIHKFIKEPYVEGIKTHGGRYEPNLDKGEVPIYWVRRKYYPELGLWSTDPRDIHYLRKFWNGKLLQFKKDSDLKKIVEGAIDKLTDFEEYVKSMPDAAEHV